jgi:hypothetical protein
MSSTVRATSSVRQGNTYFTNIATVATTDLLDATGATTVVVNNAGAWQTGTIGTVVLRDLGKTVRVPATSNGSGNYQRILRKVQRVDVGAQTSTAFPVSNGFVGFNEGVGGAADAGSGNNPSGFETFYIQIGATTAAASTPPKFVRCGLA